MRTWSLRSLHSSFIKIIKSKSKYFVAKLFSSPMASSQSCDYPRFGVIFMLGGPGAGKGSLATRLCSHFNMIHLSAGDLLRQEMATPGSEYAAEIENYIRAGAIVPVAITCSLIHNAMMEGYRHKGCVNYLIDGFPRNEDNKTGWEEAMSDKTKILQVVVVDCPEQVCIERCLNRNSGRIDDNETTLRQRIVQYKTEGLPVIAYYTVKDIVTHVDGSRSKDEVFEQAKCLLAPFLEAC